MLKAFIFTALKYNEIAAIVIKYFKHLLQSFIYLFHSIQHEIINY